MRPERRFLRVRVKLITLDELRHLGIRVSRRARIGDAARAASDSAEISDEEVELPTAGGADPRCGPRPPAKRKETPLRSGVSAGWSQGERFRRDSLIGAGPWIFVDVFVLPALVA